MNIDNSTNVHQIRTNRSSTSGDRQFYIREEQGTRKSIIYFYFFEKIRNILRECLSQPISLS